MTKKSPIQFDELDKKVIDLLESKHNMNQNLSDLRRYFASDALNGELFLLQIGTTYRRELVNSNKYYIYQESVIGYINNAIDERKEFINNSLVYMDGSSNNLHLKGLLFPVQGYAQSNSNVITYFDKRLALYLMRNQRALPGEGHFCTESWTSVYDKTGGVDTPLRGDIINLFVGKNTIHSYLEVMPKENQISFIAAYSVLPKKEKLPSRFIEEVFLKHFLDEERIKFSPEKDGAGNILKSQPYLCALRYVYKQTATVRIRGGIAINVSEFIDHEMKKQGYDKLSKILKS